MTSKIKTWLLAPSMGFLMSLSACDRDTGLKTEHVESFWTQTNLDSTHITALAAGLNGNIFAANAGFNSRVFRSLDNGDHWTRLNAGLRNELVRAFAIHLNGDIFAALYNGQISRMMTSTDQGETWATVPLPASLDIRVIACNSLGGLFIVSSASDETSPGIFRSTDNGQSWTQLPLPASFPFDLEIAPDGNIYAATSQGVYRSTDAGDTWHKRSAGLTDTTVWRVASDLSGTLYASTGRDRIFRSDDAGLRWAPTGLAKPCIDVLITNSMGDIFAGVGFYKCIEPEGIYFSSDSWKNWTQLNAGLTDKYVASFTLINTDKMSLEHEDSKSCHRPCCEKMTSSRQIASCISTQRTPRTQSSQREVLKASSLRSSVISALHSYRFELQIIDKVLSMFDAIARLLTKSVFHQCESVTKIEFTKKRGKSRS
ncbi:MAG: WD40/YVTN/BNR-like repeat-containing protein [bacterium]